MWGVAAIPVLSWWCMAEEFGCKRQNEREESDVILRELELGLGFGKVLPVSGWLCFEISIELFVSAIFMEWLLMSRNWK